jgi:hypothetical protein
MDASEIRVMDGYGISHMGKKCVPPAGNHVTHNGTSHNRRFRLLYPTPCRPVILYCTVLYQKAREREKKDACNAKQRLPLVRPCVGLGIYLRMPSQAQGPGARGVI